MDPYWGRCRRHRLHRARKDRGFCLGSCALAGGPPRASTVRRSHACPPSNVRLSAPVPDVAPGVRSEQEVEKPKVTVGAVLKKASEKAFRGGMAGFCAGIVQVASFMWMRTAMNYQYANGGNMLQVRLASEMLHPGRCASTRAPMLLHSAHSPRVDVACPLRRTRGQRLVPSIPAYTIATHRCSLLHLGRNPSQGFERWCSISRHTRSSTRAGERALPAAAAQHRRWFPGQAYDRGRRSLSTRAAL